MLNKSYKGPQKRHALEPSMPCRCANAFFFYRKASFSSSFSTSCWLFSFATSIGVLPSMFCRVLLWWREQKGDIWEGEIDGCDIKNQYSTGRLDLHSSTILQQKFHALFPTIASRIVESSVFVLIQSIYLRSCFKEDLSTFILQITQFDKTHHLFKNFTQLSLPKRSPQNTSGLIRSRDDSCLSNL